MQSFFWKLRKEFSGKFSFNNTKMSYSKNNSPKISIAMLDLVFTPTGFLDKMMRDDYCERIRQMSGDIRLGFKNTTTHVLAFHSNTEKVQLAREKKVPVVTVDWIDQCWGWRNIPLDMCVSSPDQAVYECGLFHNLRFVFSSQFDDEDRRFIFEDMVTERGGLIEKRLKDMPRMYFYICPEREPDDKIYKFATKYGIPTVHTGFIKDSIALNKLVNPDLYDVQNQPILHFDDGDEENGADYEDGDDDVEVLE